MQQPALCRVALQILENSLLFNIAHHISSSISFSFPFRATNSLLATVISLRVGRRARPDMNSVVSRSRGERPWLARRSMNVPLSVLVAFLVRSPLNSINA